MLMSLMRPSLRPCFRPVRPPSPARTYPCCMAVSARDRGIPAPLAWVAGVAAVVLGAGLGELAAGVVAPASSPVAAIGSALIDIAPPWAKDTAIAWFGTADKIALVGGIALVMLVVAALAGWLQARRPPWGVVLIAVFGVAGAVVAATRPGAGPLAWLPSVVAGASGAVALWLLLRMLRPAAAASADPSPDRSPQVDADPPDPRASVAGEPGAGATAESTPPPSRRTFFAWAGAAAGAGVLAVVVGGLRTTAAAGVAAARRALRLP